MIHEKFNLNELLIALSNAMDLAHPALMQHQQRTAYISLCMGEKGRLSYARLENLFLSSILHDIGALSTRHKVSLHEMETLDAKEHCEIGYHLYKQVSWLEEAADIVRFHHTYWHEFKDKNIDIYMDAQILHIADLIERLIDKDTYILHQAEGIRDKIKRLSGDKFHPSVVELFLEASKSSKFWFDLVTSDLDSILIGQMVKRSIYLNLEEMKIVSLMFKNIIDFRSPFTASHSTGVAACASKLASYFDFSQKEVEMMEVAGYLHDIGKLAVDNDLLEKPGRLDHDEFNVMKTHAYESYKILNDITGFETITEWAVLHHEKLDGSGYPFALSSREISLGARIFAVSDVFTALTEDRPYRKAIAKEQIENICYGMVTDKHLDALVVDKLLEHYDVIYDHVFKKKKEAYKAYENFRKAYKIN